MGSDAKLRLGRTTSSGRGVDPLGDTQNPSPDGTGPGLLPGQRVGQYELIRELGRGGMGIVYAARDTKLGRRVAIKFLLDVTGPVAERFMIEARATAQCTHENIVVIHEVNEHDGKPFMVLEFLDGQPLRDKLGNGSLPASRVVEVMLPVARALARAGELGIVHRDLKPENVFVTTTGQIKVLDFGIAKARGVAERRSIPDLHQAVIQSFTTDGSLVGTLPYMSPEQLGLDEVDHRSDLWAVGIMMFEMLSGRHPITPFTPETLITSVVSDAPLALPMGTLAPDTPPALARLIEQCLRKRKVERLVSAADVDVRPVRAPDAVQIGDCARWHREPRTTGRVDDRAADADREHVVGARAPDRAQRARRAAEHRVPTDHAARADRRPARFGTIEPADAVAVVDAALPGRRNAIADLGAVDQAVAAARGTSRRVERAIGAARQTLGLVEAEVGAVRGELWSVTLFAAAHDTVAAAGRNAELLTSSHVQLSGQTRPSAQTPLSKSRHPEPSATVTIAATARIPERPW